ncbi:hypothetical protein ACAW74_13580 [Fibrella sp. WM1]|uniref:hypothetical protein n=1 Tax=Fibrella musci TaxID=3242485 RepID=UPI00351F8828
MKKAVYIALCLALITNVSWAQSASPEAPIAPRRLQLGLDVAKMPVSWIGRIPSQRESFYTIEPLIRLEHPDRRHWWQGQLGVTRYTGAVSGQTYLNLTGGFLKAGVEWVHGPKWTQAALLTASVWQTNGNVRIPAGTFGETVIPIPTATGGTIGVEGQTNRDFGLGERWLVRVCIHYGLFHNRLPTQSMPPPYLPGLGRYVGFTQSGERAAPIALTGGVALKLLYSLPLR